MTAGTHNRLWMLFLFLLAAITAAGGVVAGLRYSPGQPIEISLRPPRQPEGRIYIGGAVSVPGDYPFSSSDSMATLLQAAGGLSGSANLSGVRLHIPEAGREQPQKININRAEAWLLKALPGIGETLAQRIINYRQQEGPFHNTGEIVRVAGIGRATYEKIKNLITVGE